MSADMDTTASTGTEAGVAAALGMAATEPTVMDPSHLYSLVVPAGAKQVTLDLERQLDRPRRVAGSTVLVDVPSFVAVFKRHGDPDTFLYADQAHSRVLAVFNDDDVAGEPGWRDHRAQLALEHTPEWTRWAGASGQLVSQQQFAQHIEDGLAEIREPDGATMLELAQSFQANSKVQFQSGTRLATGQRRLTFTETIQASAGQGGSITVPEVFVLGLAPWEGCEPYRVEARLRYRIGDGQLRIGYQLVDPHLVLRAAFTDITGQLAEQTGATVLLGTAPVPR